jgi:hypothetical protein
VTPRKTGSWKPTAPCSTGNPAQEWLPPYIVPASSGYISGIANPNLCINAANDAQQNGTVIRAYTCLPSDNAEIWQVEPGGDISLVQNLSYCLDIQNYGSAPGSVLQLYDCNAGSSQQWVAQPDGSLLNPASGLCLEDPANGASGTRLDINTCPAATDVPGMQWTLPSL